LNWFKKLIRLVTLLSESKPDVEFFISGDPGKIKLPSMILFSLVDLIFRKFDKERSIPELSIEASGYSNMITIQILNSGTKKDAEHMEECKQMIQQLEFWYRGKVNFTLEVSGYGCSVIITNKNEDTTNAIHKPTGAVSTN